MNKMAFTILYSVGGPSSFIIRDMSPKAAQSKQCQLVPGFSFSFCKLLFEFRSEASVHAFAIKLARELGQVRAEFVFVVIKINEKPLWVTGTDAFIWIVNKWMPCLCEVIINSN